MNYLLDLVILGVFLAFVVIGVHRGLVRSAVHFLGAVVAAFLSSALGGAIAKWVFDVLFRKALVEKIGASIGAVGADNLPAALEELFSSLPDFIVRALESAGITVHTLEGGLAAQSGRAAELAADALSPVFIGFLRVLAVVVLFMLFMMLVRILADLVGRMFYLPVLRQINGLLGGVFGFLMALIAVWVAISAVQVFVPMLSGDTQADVQAALQRSILTRFLITSNPLGVLFR